MRTRKDGIETKEKILQAACHIFAEKGFRDTTIAQICKKAGANIASVNYYFKDKDSLYLAVWSFLGQKQHSDFLFEKEIEEDSTIYERLYDHVATVLKSMSKDSYSGLVHRLVVLEMVNPTGLLKEGFNEMIRPLRESTCSILRELLGPKANERELELCELSLSGQCRAAQHGITNHAPGEFPKLSDSDIKELAHHITQFTYTGIQAMKLKIEHDNLLQRD